MPCRASICVEDVTERLRKQVSLRTKKNFVFDPIRDIYKKWCKRLLVCVALASNLNEKVRRKVKICPSVIFILIDDQSAKKKAVTAVIRVSSNKTVTILRANGMELYPILVVTINVTLSFERLLSDNGLLFVGFHLVKRQTGVCPDANVAKIKLEATWECNSTKFKTNANLFTQRLWGHI